MKSYKYKPGGIVNDWKILYKYDNKYKYYSGQKNYAYHVQCIKCGEERDLYGISEILSHKCECKKASKALKTLKAKYVGNIYDDKKILNFFYEKDKGIICAYFDMSNNKVRRRPFYTNLIYIIESTEFLKNTNLLIQCEKKLNIEEFKIKNEIYTTIKDLVEKFKVTKSGVIKYIKEKDFEGLELYCLFTLHKYNMKERRKG